MPIIEMMKKISTHTRKAGEVITLKSPVNFFLFSL